MNTTLSFIPAPRRQRSLPRALLLLALLGGVGGSAVALFGDGLMTPLVDATRNVIGPVAMAEIEASYYSFVETTHQWQWDLGLAPKPTAPWVATSSAAPVVPVAPSVAVLLTPTAAARPSPLPTEPARVVSAAAPAHPTSLPTVTEPPATIASPGSGGPQATSTRGRPRATAPPIASPGSGGPQATPPPLPTAGPVPLTPLIPDGALAGEGRWTSTGLPVPPNGDPAVFWKTFVRPDAARPDALVYLVRFDPRRVRLHLMAGRAEPVSPYKVPRPGQVAPADLPNLAAAFNGGFKSINGHYGMMVGGRVIALPNPSGDTGTLAVHADGRVEIGAWQTLSTAPDLVSYRQNCPLLINQGVIVVQDYGSSAWGLTVLNAMYVWRSGLGMTANGDLIYAAGNRLSANELAVALQQAGAVFAMQLDINSAWVHWLNYVRDAHGALYAAPLVPGMTYRRDQHLAPGDRDFFYLTWP